MTNNLGLGSGIWISWDTLSHQPEKQHTSQDEHLGREQEDWQETVSRSREKSMVNQNAT